jgi:D-alanyl-D-alanine dipeptidase
MNTISNHLVDVISLSKKKCEESIECHLAYATVENFLGRLVDGYHPDATQFCLLTRKAADALCHVQNSLNQHHKLGLFVFDSYRPLRAVKDFGKWMHKPIKNEHELQRKKIHYPHIEKNQLADLGYVCDDVSNHCFGDTIDLSLIHLPNKKLVHMGACFDYFDEMSHATASVKELGEEAFNNRQILTTAMQEQGFIPHEKEYWHFTFGQRDIETPMDFAITKDLEKLGM